MRGSSSLDAERARVLFVANHYPTTAHPGDSPVIARQRQALEALGYEVDVLHFDSTRSRLAYLGAIPRLLAKVYRGRRYDVIHAHYGHLCGWVARFQLRSPVVVTFRGSDVLQPSERPFSRALSRFIDGAVVMTAEMKDQLGRTDAEVVPYGIDTAVFRPSDQATARASLGLGQDVPLVLFPYDPERPEKRFDVVERAIEVVRAQVPEVQLVVLHDRSPDDVAAYMNASDVMVLASDTEGAPAAVREAVACGLPVVSVDVGDVASVIGPVPGARPTGLIVPREPARIAAAILEIVRSPYRSASPHGAVIGIDTSASVISAIYTRLNRR